MIDRNRKYPFFTARPDKDLPQIRGLRFLIGCPPLPLSVLIAAFFLLLPFGAFSQPQALPRPHDSHLKLYFYHSPVGIDWSAPRDLTRSVVKNKNSGQRRAIGHVTVQIDCGHSGESIWTGMSDDSVNYRSLVLKEGYGLGILFEKVPGRLENGENLQQEINDLAGQGRIHAIDMLISHPTCDRLQTYLREFRQRGLSQWYGLPNRPRHGEGAGCSAFGVSFLEIAGLMRDEWKAAWARELQVPEEWIGGPDNEREVPFKRLYFLRKSLNHWGQHTGDTRNVTFWDPDLMHDWVKEMLENTDENQAPQGFATIPGLQIPTLLIDARDIPIPDEPIWLDGGGDRP